MLLAMKRHNFVTVTDPVNVWPLTLQTLQMVERFPAERADSSFGTLN